MLKTLLQHLDGISDDEVVGMSVPRATPLVYELDGDMKSLRKRDPITSVSATILMVEGVEATMRTSRREINAF